MSVGRFSLDFGSFPFCFCEQEVWGVLWELDREHLDTLDRQEGVPRIYNRMKVQVKRAGGRAQDLQQDESPGKAGRRACPGSTTG